MKKLSIILIIMVLAATLTSCVGDKINPKILKTGLKTANIQRITITNNRYAGRYTIIDKESIDNFKNKILTATDATVDSKLDPDFIFEFYDETKSIGTFKYIAGLDDKNTANLMDINGNLYRVNTSIEYEFMKRLMKRDTSKNIPEYYVSLIKLLLSKINIKHGSIVVVDISKDYAVTRSITSVEQKSILDSIDGSGAQIMFPSETNTWNYLIKINTTKYTDNICNTTASVTDKNNVTVKFEIVGTYESGNWNYHIKYK